MDNTTKDTSGFYRLYNGLFQHAPNFVYAPDYSITRAERETYSYPTAGGWHWFDEESAARAFFGVPAPSTGGPF